jgi:hypothetical protein
MFKPMKTRIFSATLILLSFWFTPTTTMAQVMSKGSHHVYLGIGAPNFPVLFASALGQSGGSSFGPLIATYEYGIFRKLGIGVQLGYASYTTPWMEWRNNMGEVINYNISLALIPAMGRITWHYLNSDNADLYSGLGIGYTLAKVTAHGDVDPAQASISAGTIAFNVNLIGFRYLWTERFGVYTELGVGHNGIIVVGFSAKLNDGR